MEMASSPAELAGIELLSDRSLANWRLIGVGGAHVVLRYLGGAPELRLTVLKLRKHPLATGWILRLGLARKLRELREALTTGCGYRDGGVCQEKTIPKLYSWISAKYLPLQKVVRVPKIMADCLLRRSAGDTTNSEPACAQSHQSHAAQVTPQCVPKSHMTPSESAAASWRPPKGTPLQSNGSDRTEQEDAHSPLRLEESYTFGLLEEDLLMPPVSSSALAVDTSHSSPACKSCWERLRSGPLRFITSKVASSPQGSEQWTNAFLPSMYYAVELKPKCGLLEPPDNQQSGKQTDSRLEEAAHTKLRRSSPRTCALPYGYLTVAEEKSALRARSLTSQISQEAMNVFRTCGAQHCYRDHQGLLNGANATEAMDTPAVKYPEASAVQYFQANRFHMQQYLKVGRGQISQVSLYDPVQLFTCTHEAVCQQLSNLIANPQNNLAAFLNGVRIARFGADSSDDGLKARAESFVRRLLERIWERERNVFNEIQMLQAFAAGQQHLSLQVVRELERVLGKTYVKLCEQQFRRSVDLYSEARSLSMFESGSSVMSPCRCACLLCICLAAPRRSPDFAAAVRAQCAHEREGLNILNSLRNFKGTEEDYGDTEGKELSHIVNAAFQWLRRYLLGRTFADVSVITNILIVDGGSPLATGSLGTHEEDELVTNRLERVELDKELRTSAALLVEEHLKTIFCTSAEGERSSGEQRIITPVSLPAVFFRMTITDLDFKSDSGIRGWSEIWREIQRAYFQVRRRSPLKSL